MAFSSSFRPLKCSKAQTSFFKILDTISSIPPSTTQEKSLIHGNDDKSVSVPRKSRGIDIDLNVSIYPTTDDEESQSSHVNKKEKETKVEVVKEKSVGVLLRKDSQVRSFEVESKETGNVESSKKEREGSEGSKLKTVYINVSESDESNSEEEKKEELSYELRSARTTRNTVLPDRYKDEVVVPRISTKRKQTPRMTTRNNYKRSRRIN